MKIKIQGEKIKVTKSISDYASEKLERLCKFFKDHEEIEASAKIKLKNKLQSIEVTIPTKNFVIRAEESHEDLYAAIDLVIDKLERQIIKNKEKMLKRYQQEIIYDFPESTKDTCEEMCIVKRKELHSKPMDEEEAMLQMDLVNHDFFIFKNIEEECVSLLYKRNDGKLGIINVK